MTQYAEHYQDPENAREYDSINRPPITPRELLSPSRWLSWFLAVQEIWAMARMVGGRRFAGIVIDVPCGAGKLNAIWRTENRVVGVDVSRPMLKLYLDNGGREAVRADVTHLPFKTKSVPLVICNRLLHRLVPEDRAKVLAELRRVSSGWGLLYYKVFHPARSWMTRVSQFLRVSETRGVIFCGMDEARAEVQEEGWGIASELPILMGVAPGHVFMVKSPNGSDPSNVER